MESGSAIRTKIPHQPMPSSCAASSNSLGKPKKYCLIRNMVIADPNIPGMMSGSGVFDQPYPTEYMI